MTKRAERQRGKQGQNAAPLPTASLVQVLLPRPEVQQRIIDGAVRHLEGEIRNFQRQLERLRSGSVEP